MLRALRVITVLSVVSMASSALAQDQAQCAGSSSASGTSRDQTFCFEPERVQGSLVGATGQSTRPLRALRSDSLLRLRGHFVPEMMKSIENL
ncbi:MAG: hypothetical protein Q8Q09_22900 [Deltaproteobacteria bacterium]|nr:hypothetical protein [Deltaproteobacteria bacterium]